MKPTTAPPRPAHVDVDTMRCARQGCGQTAKDTLYRVNEVGVSGVFMCKTHEVAERQQQVRIQAGLKATGRTHLAEGAVT